MWSCATTDTAHDQRSYLTAARQTVAEWRSAFTFLFTNKILVSSTNIIGFNKREAKG